MFIHIQDVSYTYEDSPIHAIDGLTASFSEGWTGIVGSNGAGKSTLLALLCGSENPSSGSIIPAVKGTYCAQATDTAPDTLYDFAADYSPYALRLRSMLELEDEWIWRYDTLSHGEKKRVQVACALAFEPALLALDEPTNHLDTQTREILLETLRQYRGVGIIVSHDRTFLDGLAYQCLFLEGGTGTMMPGTYTEGKLQMDRLYSTAQSERRRARDELSRVQGEAKRRKAEAGRSASRRSGRNLDKHDSDGRGRLRLAIVSGQDGKAGLLSAQMNKKVELAQNRLDDARVTKSYDKPLEIDTEPIKAKTVAHLSAGSIAMGEDRLLRFPELFVGPTDRIGLRGRNGAGKSTLLSVLQKNLKEGIEDRLVSIPQEIAPQEGRALLSELKALPPLDKGRVFSIVARLNSSPSRLLSGEDLSPGELRKAMLALGLLKRPCLIVMDEPTNHLDIHSIEALQDVLRQCSCALMLVSHDGAFLDDLTNTTWSFQVGQGNDDTETQVVVS